MVKPLIFISHSAKDSEVAPVDPTDIEAVQRRQRLEYTRLVRSEIVSALSRLEDENGNPRFEVWLDRDVLAGGDDWTAKIHYALGTCHGAVVLLDSVSVQSDWVHKEATILTWRQSLASRVLVVPVFLGDFPFELVETGPWAPISIQRLQGVKLPVDTMTVANAKRLAALVAERFETLELDEADTPMDRWVADLAAMLEEVRLPHRRRAARMLGIEDAEWRALDEPPVGRLTLGDPHVTMAHHLLHSRLVDVYEAVVELLRGLDADGGRWLVGQVFPIWVPEAAGSHLRSTVVGEGARLILVDLEEQKSAIEYVDRGWCGRRDKSALIGVPKVTGEDDREALADVEHSMRQALRIEANEQHQLETHLRITPEMFVLLGPNAATPTVIRVLREKYEAVHLLVWQGHRRAALHAELPDAVLIQPSITEAEETIARTMRNKLDMNIAT